MNNENLEDLRGLAPHDVDAKTASRIQRTALAAFDAAHEGGFGARFALIWSRVGVPVMLAGVVVVYLGWVVQAASSLYR